MKTRCEESSMASKGDFGALTLRPLTGRPSQQTGNNPVMPGHLLSRLLTVTKHQQDCGSKVGVSPS